MDEYQHLNQGYCSIARYILLKNEKRYENVKEYCNKAIKVDNEMENTRRKLDDIYFNQTK